MAVCCEVEGWMNRGFRGEYVWAWPYRRGKVEELKNYNGLKMFVNIFFIVLNEIQGKFPEKYCVEPQTLKSWNCTRPPFHQRAAQTRVNILRFLWSTHLSNLLGKGMFKTNLKRIGKQFKPQKHIWYIYIIIT